MLDIEISHDIYGVFSTRPLAEEALAKCPEGHEFYGCGIDEYEIDRMAGAFGTTLDNDICCFKYGNGIMDDQSMWGVLQMNPSDKYKVDIVNFGLITPDSKFKRSSCEASYCMWLN